MERRSLLKQLALAGLATAIPFRKLLASVPLAPSSRPFHQSKLGDLELYTVTDGFVHFPHIQPDFAKGVPRKEVDELLIKNFRSVNEMDLGINILLIKRQDKFILIDTGVGGAFGKDSGWLQSSLADAGISPNSVSDIVISHGHPDHIGGVLNSDGQLAFPNATIHISRIEYDFWMAPTQDFSKSTFENKELLHTFTLATQKTLTTIKPKLHLFEDGDKLLDCIRLELAPGHTPGHTVTHIFSKGEEVAHIADLVHSDVLLFPHPEWGFNGDTDLQQAAATRRKVLANLAEKGTKVFAYHLPWPGVGHVRKNGKGFEWVAETYAIPG
ncbi:MBL fold metallo-hydrolase [Chitinophaga sp. Hz27]|uniref:MBL fold metallo-hydrolase n=1 Tax=Chitinophaga sp. Hz27 TaxID=3347169 RepID=UPI0035E363BE